MFDYFENLSNDKNHFYILIGYNLLFNNFSSICHYEFYFKFYIESTINSINLINSINSINSNNLNNSNDLNYLNIDISIKDIIDNNFKLYYEEIVGGNIPINFLNYNDLNKKLDKYIDILKSENYIFISNIDEIIKIINKKKSISNPDKLYFASFELYENEYNVIENNIINAYTEIWLAIISLFGNNISKGFKNNKPYIHDYNNYILNNEKNIYLYEIYETKNFIPIVNDEYIYKYYIYNLTYFNDKIIITNLNEYFENLDIYIKFKKIIIEKN
jgi:hypothetical protein